jgi:hypothetical protein
MATTNEELSICVITCVHDTPAVTAGGKRMYPKGTPIITRRRRGWKRKTSNPVASVCFTPATTEVGVRLYVYIRIEID